MAKIKIESDLMTVTVDGSFPRVIKYKWKDSGAKLYGQDKPIREIMINGVLQTPEVSCTVTDNRVTYAMKCPEGKCDIQLYLEVDENVLRLRVTEIKEHRWFPVNTIEIPGHSLISINSGQKGAALARVKGSALVDTQEEFVTVKKATVDINPQTVMYAMINTRELAATIHNNVIHDYARLNCQTTEIGKEKRTSVWNGTWIYREVESEAVVLPSADVIVTADRNGDGVVDWQDAAIAYREVMFRPLGTDSIRNWVVSQIAMNFASLAQNPFLRVLDNVKKINLHTDGLGQMLQFKGYQSEGHDSAHPDYGKNVNQRAGGVDELNFVMERMEEYACDAGIHMNATEAYPEAKAYDDTLIYDVDNWRWLDQSKSIDKRYDAVSGNLHKRMDEMKIDLPALKWTYVDVYFGYAWDAWKLATKLNANGWPLFTEFPHVAERYAVWTHTSQEFDKWGIKSKLVRFIHNSEKDVWPRKDEPMLRGSRNLGFMGWHTERDYNAFLKNVFTNNLPTKFIQHFPIMQWDDAKIVCDGGVEITTQDDVVTISRNGNAVAIGDATFIPWNPLTEDKIYHWNPVGGKSTWNLPATWAKAKKVKLYRLTDLGRTLVGDLVVKKGAVTIDAEKDVPYVIYAKAPKAQSVMEWGEGALVKDPGFDSHGFDSWTPSASTKARKHIAVVNDDKGQTHLRVSGKNDGSVSQTLSLKAGKTYAASVWCEVEGERKATLGIRMADGTEVINYMTKSDLPNYSDNQAKYLTNYQRMKVLFTMPKRQTEATLFLHAAKGDAKSAVNFDDVRVVETVPVDTKGHWFFEDFENCDEGWGPFVYGYKGDVRTHLAERHEPYTDDVINGNWSFKTTDEKPNLGKPKGKKLDTVTESERDMGDDGKTGIVVRTTPYTIRFAPKKTYALAFEYNAEKDGQYMIVVRSGKGKELLCSPLNGDGHFEGAFKTAADADTFVAILKNDNERGALVIDDLAIDEK